MFFEFDELDLFDFEGIVEMNFFEIDCDDDDDNDDNSIN